MDKQIDMFGTIIKTNREPDKEIPEGIKLKKGQRWCPHCSHAVIFVRDKELGVKRCPYCGISNRDYVNKSWIR